MLADATGSVAETGSASRTANGAGGDAVMVVDEPASGVETVGGCREPEVEVGRIIWLCHLHLGLDRSTKE